MDAHEKEKLSDEEVETEVFVDSVAVTLQASEEAEREEADGQAHERHSNTHPGDDGEEDLVHAPVSLQKHTRKAQAQFRSCTTHHNSWHLRFSEIKVQSGGNIHPCKENGKS